MSDTWPTWLTLLAEPEFDEEPTEPTAAFTSAQIASPCLMNSALLSAVGVGVVAVAVDAVDPPPPPPQPAMARARRDSKSRQLRGLIRGATLAERLDTRAGALPLRPRAQNAAPCLPSGLSAAWRPIHPRRT